MTATSMVCLNELLQQQRLAAVSEPTPENRTATVRWMRLRLNRLLREAAQTPRLWLACAGFHYWLALQQQVPDKSASGGSLGMAFVEQPSNADSNM